MNTRSQAIFYNEVIPVSSKRHGGAAVKVGDDFSFARHSNAVPVTTVEFASVEPEYAIVFAGSDEAVMPMVVLSPRQDDNRYVNDDGHWKARYVPAYVRRYPFVFSSSNDGKTFTLCVDETFSGFNTAGRGERLFDADGERTQYLNNVLNFQQEYQAHFKATQSFCGKLKDLELLEPVEARFPGVGGQTHTLTGLLVINREKLHKLSDEQLGSLVRSGQLELIYRHLHSLHHLNALGESFKEQAQAAPVPPPGPGSPSEDLGGGTEATDVPGPELMDGDDTHQPTH